MAQQKTFLIECADSGGYHGTRPTRYRYQEGTLEELIRAYSYTLEVGESWQNEKGNKKVNTNPRSVKSLVDNLNKATNNAAANGYSGKYYSLAAERKE
jgi:hypothetical protein